MVVTIRMVLLHSRRLLTQHTTRNTLDFTGINDFVTLEEANFAGLSAVFLAVAGFTESTCNDRYCIGGGANGPIDRHDPRERRLWPRIAADAVPSIGAARSGSQICVVKMTGLDVLIAGNFRFPGRTTNAVANWD